LRRTSDVKKQNQRDYPDEKLRVLRRTSDKKAQPKRLPHEKNTKRTKIGTYLMLLHGNFAPECYPRRELREWVATLARENLRAREVLPRINYARKETDFADQAFGSGTAPIQYTIAI